MHKLFPYKSRPGAIVALVLASVSFPASGAGLNDPLSYNRDIRPILSDNCFACHGPDKNKRKGKLRLDDRDSALQKEAFVPRKPEQSELVKRIFSADPKQLMPPPESNKRLTNEQKQVLRRWIEEGARYEPHWAYITPQRPRLPAVSESGWARNPVDAFILRTLEDRKLGHAPEADRRTLLRRLSLDLTGLPPTPSEVRAFLEDKSADAYEKQVDRLLASPHYGERMAVPWLDAVRFADTVGFHGDQNQNVFPYRDYVIDAFNHNKPFDQFTIEQIAGDLLPHPTTEKLVATCFNRLTMMTREGGAQPKEYLAKYMADRVRTIGSAWLGSTLNCCECHDHKYDPFTARDFYSLGAFFADIKQWGVYMDYGYTPNPDLKGWSNDHPFPPEIVVDSPYLQRRRERLMRQIDQVVAGSAAGARQNAEGEAKFDDWKREVAGFLKSHDDLWATVQPVGLSEGRPDHGPVMAEDGAVLFPRTERMTQSRRSAAGDRIEFALPAGKVAAIRLQLLPSETHHGSILRDGGAGETVQITVWHKSTSGDPHRVAFYYADADLKDDRYSNGYPILGVADAWKTAAEYSHSTQTAVYVLREPLHAAEGDRLVISFNRNSPGCVRVAESPIAPLNPIDPTLPDSLRHALSGLDHSPADESLLRLTYLLSTEWDADALTEVRRLHRQVLECRDGKSPVMVTMAVAPYVTRVLRRGNWQDESGPVVPPAVPHFLPQPTRGKERLTRLDLAQWLVSPENPLTARVLVNRLWKQFFGSGLCNTVEDLGAQGEWPLHPELLDWLAVEFRESGWDVKHMVRLMVTSAAYRQDSDLPPVLREIDPNDRLLAAQAPRRVEAEFVRDNALFAAGLLNLDLGGPSVKPYQPAGYYANIQFPDRDYIPDRDERQWRRGVYMHWQRTFLHPMLANFDAPSREDGICTRNISNTPQQALTLLNDPTFVEAARALAAHVLAGHLSDDAGRFDFVYERTLCRVPNDAERRSLEAFLATQRDYYKAHVDDARKLIHVGIAPAPTGENEAELAAWTSVCRVVLNLHETITRY